MKKIDETQQTEHGRNIADQIQVHDAYGRFDNLTLADIWQILDNLHTHFMDTKRDNKFLSRWMDELQDAEPDMDTL